MRIKDRELHLTVGMNLINVTLSERNQPPKKKKKEMHAGFFHLYKVQKWAELIYAAGRQESD